jgi:hypothetical protein
MLLQLRNYNTSIYFILRMFSVDIMFHVATWGERLSTRRSLILCDNSEMNFELARLLL